MLLPVVRSVARLCAPRVWCRSRTCCAIEAAENLRFHHTDYVVVQQYASLSLPHNCNVVASAGVAAYVNNNTTKFKEPACCLGTCRIVPVRRQGAISRSRAGL